MPAALQKWIVTGIIAMLGLLLVVTAVAVTGFLNTQEIFQDVDRQHISRLQTAGQLVEVSLEIEAKIRQMESSHTDFELDSASFALFQLLDKLNNTIDELQRRALASDKIDELRSRVLSLETAINETNTHMREAAKLDAELQKLVHRVHLLRDGLIKQRLKTAAGKRPLWIDSASDALHYLHAAAAVDDSDSISDLGQQFEIAMKATLAAGGRFPEAKALYQQLQVLGYGEDSLYELRYKMLVKQYAFQSTVKFNMAQLNPLTETANSILAQIKADIRTSMDQQNESIGRLVQTVLFICGIGLVLAVFLVFRLKQGIHALERQLRRSED